MPLLDAAVHAGALVVVDEVDVSAARVVATAAKSRRILEECGRYMVLSRLTIDKGGEQFGAKRGRSDWNGRRNRLLSGSGRGGTWIVERAGLDHSIGDNDKGWRLGDEAINTAVPCDGDEKSCKCGREATERTICWLRCLETLGHSSACAGLSQGDADRDGSDGKGRIDWWTGAPCSNAQAAFRCVRLQQDHVALHKEEILLDLHNQDRTCEKRHLAISEARIRQSRNLAKAGIAVRTLQQ